MRAGDIVRFKTAAELPDWMLSIAYEHRSKILARVIHIHGQGTRAQIKFEAHFGDNFRIGELMVIETVHSYDVWTLEVVESAPEVAPGAELPQQDETPTVAGHEFKVGDIVRFKGAHGESLKWFNTLDSDVKPYIFGEVKGFKYNGLMFVQFHDHLGLNKKIKIHRHFHVDNPTKLNPRRFEKVPDALLTASIDQAMGRIYRRSSGPVTVSQIKGLSGYAEMHTKKEQQMNNIMYKTKAVLDRACEDLRLNKAAIDERRLAKKLVAEKAKEFAMMDDLGCRICTVTVEIPDATDHTERLERIIRCLEACSTKEIPYSDDIGWVMTDKSNAWKGVTTSRVTVDVTEA